ncbi:Methyltransferase domain family [gamma proteobacterium HTCC5015]|nr:Methyltransferase domain family [gamma proteobacterium HTCC5015]
MAKAKKTSSPSMADQADRHDLYEQAVQCSEFEIDWVVDHFQTLRGRPLREMREDFCGTANAACEFVARHADNRAVGVDLDPEVLEWGRRHRVEPLEEAGGRVELIEGDVLAVDTPPVDALLAMNFSYWLFKSRPQLLAYFKKARGQLKDDGVLYMDAFGGYDCFKDDEEEETEHDDFTYVWHLSSFNPITHEATYYIHFRFDDGSSLERAFEYHWRHWGLPEIRELLEEAGFSRVTIYMQAWDDEEDEPADEFVACEEADADPGWVAYITAEK